MELSKNKRKTFVLKIYLYTMGFIADLLEKVVNVNYSCPECGNTPPKDNKTLRYFEKESSSNNRYRLKCNECGNTFSAYICYKCGRGYKTRGDFSIFQKDIGSGVKAYNCKCSNNLYVKQGGIH